MIFTPETVQSRLRDRPFVALRIVTTAGQTYDVYHPDLVFVGSHFLIIGFPRAENPGLADRVTRIALAHVTELLDLPQPVRPPESNGLQA